MAEIKKINRETPPIVKGKIANAITSAAKGHVVATTDDIYDTNFLEYQNEINERFSTGIEVVKENVEVLETDVDAIELDVSSLKEHVSDIDESLESVQGEVDSLQNKVSGIGTRLETVEGEVSGIDTRLETVEGEVSTIQGEVAGIRSDMSDVQDSVSQIQGEVADIHGNIAEINSAITEVSSEVADIHGNIAEINSAITEINYDLSKKIEKSIFDTLSSRTPTEKDRDFVYRDENDNILVVDKKNGGGSDVWVKITDVADYTSGGKYLFVREENNIAFNSASSPIDVDGNIISVVITDNKIAFDQTTDNASFIISDIDGGVSILSSGGYYIGRTQNSNGVESSQEAVYVNTLSFDENGNVVITSSGGPKLQKNSSGNRFRYFKSAQHLIQLYKKVESSTPDEFKWKRLISDDDININAITTEELDEILIPQCIPGNKMDC